VHYTTSCNTQSNAPEDGQNNCPKHDELIGIINKPLLLHLVGCLYYYDHLHSLLLFIKIQCECFWSYVDVNLEETNWCVLLCCSLRFLEILCPIVRSTRVWKCNL